MSESGPIFEADEIRERLAGTIMPVNPAIPVMPDDSDKWPGDFVARAARGLTPAGVLIPVMERDHGLSVLLTERSSQLKLHAGQVSFPGGRMESGDLDIRATALRETHEEVGIPPDAVDVAGFLAPSPTVTGYSVTPVVGLIREAVPIIVDPSEVETAFEVPLEFLMDGRNQQDSMREFEGVMLKIVEFHFGGHRIWGATATMLLQLRNILTK